MKYTMSQYGTPAGIQTGQTLSREQQDLRNLVSSAAAEAAKAAVESTPFEYTGTTQQPRFGYTQPIQQAPAGFTQPTQQGALAGQTPPARQTHQVQPARTTQPRQIDAPQPAQQKQQRAVLPSFSQQATSPRLSAFQQRALQEQGRQQYSPAVDVREPRGGAYLRRPPRRG